MYHTVASVAVVADSDINSFLPVGVQSVVIGERKIFMGYIAQFFCRFIAFKCICGRAVVVECKINPCAAAVERILRRDCRLCFDFVAVVIHGVKAIRESDSNIDIFGVWVQRIC